MLFLLACAAEVADPEATSPAAAAESMRWASIAFVCDEESLLDALDIPTDDPAIVSLVMQSGAGGVVDTWTVMPTVGLAARDILPARLCGSSDIGGRLTVGWLE